MDAKGLIKRNKNQNVSVEQVPEHINLDEIFEEEDILSDDKYLTTNLNDETELHSLRKNLLADLTYPTINYITKYHCLQGCFAYKLASKFELFI